MTSQFLFDSQRYQNAISERAQPFYSEAALCCMQHSGCSIYSQSSFIPLPLDNLAYLPKALKKKSVEWILFSHKKLGVSADCLLQYLLVCVFNAVISNKLLPFPPRTLSLILPLFSWQIHDKTIIRLCCLRKCLKLVSSNVSDTNVYCFRPFLNYESDTTATGHYCIVGMICSVKKYFSTRTMYLEVLYKMLTIKFRHSSHMANS